MSATVRLAPELSPESLVRAHGARVLATCRRILDEPEAAAEAVQDTFTRAFDELERALPAEPLARWLGRLAISSALARLPAAPPGEEPPPRRPGFLPDGHHQRTVRRSPRLADGPGSATRARQLLDGLPRIHRLALLLADGEGLSTGEGAALLGVAPEVFKRRVHEARLALLEELT